MPKWTKSRIEVIQNRIFLNAKKRWGIDLCVAIVQKSLALSELSPGERAVYQSCGKARQQHWLLGRTALKDVLRRMGQSTDTAGIKFPNPYVSLSHCRGLAVAIGSSQITGGLGVDVETVKKPSKGAERHYLTPKEIRSDEPVLASTRQRLWTVKEAIFKADLCNLTPQSSLTQYEIKEPKAIFGQAKKIRYRSQIFCYGSFGIKPGWISVAFHLS